MADVKSVCVFCGARSGLEAHYSEEGKKFGKMLAEKGLRLVYGGANCGIMGAIANGVLEAKGKVTGVFPSILDGIEDAHSSLTEIILVDDMHSRKMMMFEKADAFVVFPGGFGTMDETFEVITWKQLHTHAKPIILYNYKGYWNHWVEFTEHIINKGFAAEVTRELYDVVDTMPGIFEKMGYK